MAIKYLKFEICVPERNIRLLRDILARDRIFADPGNENLLRTFLDLDSGYWQGGERQYGVVEITQTGEFWI